MAYSYQTANAPVAQNSEQFLAGHQAYIDNQWQNYLQEKDAYKKFNDMNARSQYEAEAESEYQQQSSTNAVGLSSLSGGLSGASIGTSISPGWGTLIGAIVGTGAGLVEGLGNKSAAKKQYDAAMTKGEYGNVASFAGTDPNITGWGAGAKQIFGQSSQIAGLIGQAKAGQKAADQSGNIGSLPSTDPSASNPWNVGPVNAGGSAQPDAQTQSIPDPTQLPQGNGVMGLNGEIQSAGQATPQSIATTPNAANQNAAGPAPTADNSDPFADKRKQRYMNFALGEGK